MKPNAAPAASARRAGPKTVLFCVIAGLAGLAAPAEAGDRALLEVIGFSGDARYFAFEEFGIQDGSGFAYANLYVIDLAADRWVTGSPVRVQATDEARSLVAVRAEAAGAAAGLIEKFDITVPGEIVALLGDGVPDADGRALAFGRPGYAPGAVLEPARLALETFEAAAANPDCAAWFGTPPRGFALHLIDAAGTRLIHRDAAPLPRSRGCPLDYRLHAVVLPSGAAALDAAVALVSSYPGGFEGPDRRFLAVPLAR